MAAFLAWLYEQAVKIYAWFGGLFWQFYVYLLTYWDNLRSILSQAINYTNNVISGVYAWVINKIANATDTIYNVVRGWINAVYNVVSGWINTVYSTVNGWINRIYDTVSSWLSNVYNTVASWIVDAKNSIMTQVTQLINGVIALFNPILAYYNKIVNFFTWFTGEVLAKLDDYVNNAYSTVIPFVSDPVGFVLGAIQSVFVSFMCYRLARGLGTTIYELPPEPIWSIFNSPPPPPPSSDGGAGAGILGKPLSKVYVSGYTFSPGHPGVDLGLVRGQPVYAVHDGIVEFAGWSTVGYGINVVIRGDIWWSRYAHLQSVNVGVGQHVDRGTVVGLGNSTGNSTGDHLHLEIKKNGMFVDPMLYISK